MLAFVFLAAFIAAFFAPAAFAVPTSTNTGLSPRETVGQYKFYLNADQFTATDGIDQAPTPCYNMRLTEFSETGETTLSGPDFNDNCNEDLDGKWTIEGQWWIVSASHTVKLYDNANVWFNCDGSSDTSTCTVNIDDVAEGTSGSCAMADTSSGNTNHEVGEFSCDLTLTTT